jgi:hypothetical protein
MVMDAQIPGDNIYGSPIGCSHCRHDILLNQFGPLLFGRHLQPTLLEFGDTPFVAANYLVTESLLVHVISARSTKVNRSRRILAAFCQIEKRWTQ